MKQPVPARIYCIPATKAPVVAVLRRGPGKWSHVGLWNLAKWRFEPGAWLRGKIFPRRCDLSPDGRFLCYFARKGGAQWENGETYVAVSRLPWLKALKAFGTCGTWTRGYRFEKGGRSKESGVVSLPIRFRLASIPLIQFALERERGWTERPDSPPRASNDWWDEGRGVRMQKRQPGGERLLCMERLRARGGFAGLPGRPPGGYHDDQNVGYWMEENDDLRRLNHVQWADWDADGHLLVATRRGVLQAWQLDDDRSRLLFAEDLSQLGPDPRPAPAWAARW